MILNFSSLKKNQYANSIYIALVCFLTYSCIFAFRKPFTVGLYKDMSSFLGVDFKNLLVISQVLGYTASKFFGVKYIAELKNVGRGKLIFILTLLSLLPLFLFPFVPTPINILCLFANGFPLGMTWGIIFSFAEGRRGTDFIGAAMGASIIVSSGFAKSVGKWMQLYFHISDMWLPFYTGLVFVIPIILLVYLLEQIPAPSPDEVELKSARLPMSNIERMDFFKKFMPGIISFIFIYLVLTLFRDLRDNFAADIWSNLGYSNSANVFTNSELPIAIIVLTIIASMILIKNNSIVFLISQYMIIAGFLIVLVSSMLFQYQLINGFYWMLFVGLGLYIGYTPFNSIMFDRMIATFRLKGNVGFLIYLMDSFGYLASVIVISVKGAAHITLNWAEFYAKGVLYCSVIGLIVSILSLLYYTRKIKQIQYE
jgi:MFS family permease